MTVMLERDSIPGAKWWKFDFHCHTPASVSDFGRGFGLDEGFNDAAHRNWLLAAMTSGVDCFVITDHNSGAWIDPLTEELHNLNDEQPDGYRQIFLFPGVEISVNGNIHVLAIFDPSCTTENISALLGAVGYGGRHGESETCTTRTFVEVVAEIVRRGGIAIPAHVDKTKGLFREVSGQTLEQCLKTSGVAAMEVVQTDFEPPELFATTKAGWTSIIGSDAHSPDQIGSRYTWIKMGEPNIEGLKLALTDGQLSLCRFDTDGGDKNQHASEIVQSLEVREARYCGRGDPLEVRFSPWLNAIIGGRGTGKSTLMELSRICLRREAEIADMGTIKRTFDEFNCVPHSRDDRGALTNDTRVSLKYRKDGVTFRINWQQSEDVAAIEQQHEDGQTWEQVPGDVTRRFPVRLYSQKQIFEMATGPESLLHVIDDSPEVDRSDWLSRWREEESRYLALCAQAREIEASLTEEGPVRGQLADIKRRLNVFEDAGQREVLTAFQTRQRQATEVARYTRTIRRFPEAIVATAKGILPSTFELAEAEPNAEESVELTSISKKLVDQMSQIQAEMLALGERARDAIYEWRQGIHHSSWRASVQHSKVQYAELVARLEGVGRPDEYAQFVKKRQQLEEQIVKFSAKRQKLREMKNSIAESLSVLQTLRQELTEKRRAFLASVLSGNQYVQMRIIPYGNRAIVADQFRRLIGKEGAEFQNDIWSDDTQRPGVIGALYMNYPSEAVATGQFEQRLLGMKSSLVAVGMGTAELTGVRDRRFEGHLQRIWRESPEAFDRLMVWFPEDSVRVSYCPAPGQRFRPIEQGSPGQKTAAILAFLLAHGDEPIILDQPEDDLDNLLIYDLIVKQLRQNKLRRQIIVVTHNPNIVVNGDAEFVMVLDVANGQTYIQPYGCLQEQCVRDAICSVMEGGREAFEQRYRRISAAVNT